MVLKEKAFQCAYDCWKRLLSGGWCTRCAGYITNMLLGVLGYIANMLLGVLDYITNMLLDVLGCVADVVFGM